jgi:hypothetical protein
MGNSHEYLTQQLTFIQHLQDPRFGHIDVFRNQDGTFLMKSTLTHILHDKRCHDFKKILSWVQQEGHKLIVPVVKATFENRMCCLMQRRVFARISRLPHFTLSTSTTPSKMLSGAAGLLRKGNCGCCCFSFWSWWLHSRKASWQSSST